MTVKKIWANALSFFFSYDIYCYICGRYQENAEPVCESCQLNLPHTQNTPSCQLCSKPILYEDAICYQCQETPPCYPAQAIYYYQGDLKELIYQFKFKKTVELKCWFTAELKRIYRLYYQGYYLVAAPKRKKKKWDQLEEIFTMLKKDKQLAPYVLPCLKRLDTIPQKSLHKEDRLKHLQGNITFRSHYNKQIKGRPCLFIDDVMTTGATAQICGRVLQENGASEVRILVIARVV